VFLRSVVKSLLLAIFANYVYYFILYFVNLLIFLQSKRAALLRKIAKHLARRPDISKFQPTTDFMNSRFVMFIRVFTL